ncbi:hypothetical protein BVC71_14005 [Marivivens niveibacter]|uniref:STAS/SEC14 domain-containing protein n=1 Tax=Marivivens niveibacter TaxID=1930667 RepID=A0A251WV56_9RHOB|nr:hypothetical protein [Marivivens niveibacter]OUD08282.1 hypothetical protein BVC71_14005 [Marivivens niveibacter]
MITSVAENGYIRHRFTGVVDADQVRDWYATLDLTNEATSGGIYAFIDYSQLKSITKKAMDLIVDVQRDARDAGLVRVAVVVNSGMLQLQTERLARSSAIYNVERYISSDRTPNWEDVAKAWLIHGIEPSAYRGE